MPDFQDPSKQSPREGFTPKREPLITIPVHAESVEVAPGLRARFLCPDAWIRSTAPLNGFERAVWKSPNGFASLVLSSEAFASGTGRDEQLSRTVGILTSQGHEVPLVTCLPVQMRDGSSAWLIHFPVKFKDGGFGFEYSHVCFVEKRWIRLAIVAETTPNELADCVAKFHPITSSIRTKR